MTTFRVFIPDGDREEGIAWRLHYLIKENERLKIKVAELTNDFERSLEKERDRAYKEAHDSTWIRIEELRSLTLEEINKRINQY